MNQALMIIVMTVGAFRVSGACLSAAHMGFVIGMEPEMLVPLIGDKLNGAVAAAALALWVQRKDASPVHMK